MLFNSFVFIGFFIVVYIAYVSLRNRYKAQNGLLLIASYVFYGYWDIRFLLLLLFSTVVDFFVGQWIGQINDERSRRLLMIVSVLSNLSILGFFKYFNFFTENFAQLLSSVGLQTDFLTLNIILPVGISFYTFQTLSYTLDIYRGTLKPISSFIDFALFVSFFPQLVAGPIERASNLLPQITSPRSLNYSQINAGLFLILWGYFKKMVVADNLAGVVDDVFDDYTDYQGLDVWLGAIAFTLQIYGDFSGYSDIARGLAKLMGFELMLNFKLPYFATNPSDFWSRWHISLSTWFRDYVYIPLGGSRQGTMVTYRNLLITMLLCGLWHGAAWNFVLWGAFHGALLMGYHGLRPLLRSVEKASPDDGAIASLGGMMLMFVLTIVGWIMFRSTSVQQMSYMLTHLGFSTSRETLDFVSDLLFFGTPLLLVQVWQYRTQDLLIITKLRPWFRIPILGVMLAWIILFSDRDTAEFIYFQF